MELAGGPLRLGDRIAYELPVDFAEEVTSLEVVNSPVDNAPVGAQAGIKTSLMHQLRNGALPGKPLSSQIEAGSSS